MTGAGYGGCRGLDQPDGVPDLLESRVVDKEKGRWALPNRPFAYALRCGCYAVTPWRSSLPEVAPVQLPSSNVTSPLTMVYLYPSARWTRRHSSPGRSCTISTGRTFNFSRS